MNEPQPTPGDLPPGSEASPSPGGVSYGPAQEIVRAELSQPGPEPPPEEPPRRRRRIRLPIILFLLTCFSTFLAGVCNYFPPPYLMKAAGIFVADDLSVQQVEPSLMPLRRDLLENWPNGLLYMACVLAILLTHELGHFVMTLVHRVRASLPYFIPFPISPFGTMGAVIAMDARSANRREIFDIGLAGPIAGLVVAIPVMWIGVQRMDLSPAPGEPRLHAPLLMRLAIDHAHPGKYDAKAGFAFTRANAWFMAGWVGLLVTGLNMLPVSQLDGGHVTYALFGRRAHWVARGFMLVAFVYMGVMSFVFRGPPDWVLMAILVMFLGTDHPPTSDDNARLGPLRVAIGYASLLIPVFCFVPNLTR
jgi:Zn-dependent protease